MLMFEGEYPPPPSPPPFCMKHMHRFHISVLLLCRNYTPDQLSLSLVMFNVECMWSVQGKEACNWLTSFMGPQMTRFNNLLLLYWHQA